LKPAEAFAELLEILDKMEIPYAVGGSVASSVHGIPRTTMDVDLVADIHPDQVKDFAALLHPRFYADALAIADSLNRGRSFNVIHLASAYKFDIFPLRKDSYSQASFARRRFAEVRALGPEPLECAIAAPEDTILRKLEWYRASGEASERQWSDLRGVMRVSGDALDREYLRKWAKYLKVDDLLERLLRERYDA
jgi:hypothetical protein